MLKLSEKFLRATDPTIKQMAERTRQKEGAHRQAVLAQRRYEVERARALRKLEREVRAGNRPVAVSYLNTPKQNLINAGLLLPGKED